MTAPAHIDSFYRAAAPEPAARSPLAGTLTADCAVVGAGLAGLTTARELARAGRSVVLLESDRVGWAASGRNGGFVSPGYAEGMGAVAARVGKADARRLWDLSVEGADYVERTLSLLGRTDLIQGRGALGMWRYPARDEMLRSAERMARDYDFHLEPLETEAVRAELNSKRYFNGLRKASSIQINPLAYAEILAADCARAGVRIFEGSPARSLARGSDGWTVATPEGQVTAGQVVLAGNVGMGGLYPQLARAVLPVATYVVVTEKLGDRLRDLVRFRGAVTDSRRAGDYYRIVDGDRLLWGGKITTRQSVPPKLKDVMRATIADVYPALNDIRIDWAWIGHMGYAIHKMPIARELAPGLISATALGGHGLNTAGAVALAVVEHMTGTSDRLRLFQPYGARWGGGMIGRLATQAAYWHLQAQDWWDEKRGSGQGRF